MARRRRHSGGGGHEGGGLERWLLTYADMITLLLALFIVLFAMSTIDVVRFDALRKTLSQTFKGEVLSEPGSVIDGSQGVLDNTAQSQSDPNMAWQMDQEAARAQLSASFDRERERLEEAVKEMEKHNGALKGKLEITTSERGIVIRLAGDTFFASGSATLREELQDTLVPLARDMKREHRQVRVEGHTDGAPISTVQFPDNLELSTARANSVYRFLNAHGVRPVSSAGYADTNPVVQPPSDDPTASIAKNRRVEIVVLAPGANVGGAEARSTYGAQPTITPPPRTESGGASPTSRTFNAIGNII